jgi:hypothetical protein
MEEAVSGGRGGWTEADCERLRLLSIPLQAFIAERGDPLMIVVVASDRSDIYSAELGIPMNNQKGKAKT